VFTKKHRAMLLKFEDTHAETDTSFLKYATLWGPDDEDADEEDDTDWNEEDDDDGTDLAEDLDEIQEIQADDGLDEPDPEDEEHFPEEDE
jgi:hypothetical protein